MNKSISWILVITLLLCTLCACTPTHEEKSGTETETPTNAPSEAAPSGVDSTEPEATDEPTATDAESTVRPLPELPSDPAELEMLYRRAHGLEDDAAFEEYCLRGRVGKTPLPSLISVDHLSVGMTREQVCNMIPWYAGIWVYSAYRCYTTDGQPLTAIFFVDCDERYVVLEFDTEERIERITAYDEVVETVPTADEINAIPEGATVYEVIDVLGFPRYSTLDGNRYYCFTDDRLYGYGLTDVYDNNLRLYSSQLDRITDEVLVWVDPPAWLADSSEPPTEEKPKETIDPEEPSLLPEEDSLEEDLVTCG